MILSLLYRYQWMVWKGTYCASMYSSTTLDSAAAIVLSCSFPSVPPRPTFRSSKPAASCRWAAGRQMRLWDDSLNGNGFGRGNVLPHHLPSPYHQLQLEVDNVGAKLLVGLHLKLQWLKVEDCHTYLALAWGISGEYVVSRRVPRVDAVSNICLLD